jgi:hypothetical protein
MTRPPNRAALLVAGWRCDGYRWYPPWPSPYSYTFAAAQLEQARQPKPKRKDKRIIVQEQPHE